MGKNGVDQVEEEMHLDSIISSRAHIAEVDRRGAEKTMTKIPMAMVGVKLDMARSIHRVKIHPQQAKSKVEAVRATEPIGAEDITNVAMC